MLNENKETVFTHTVALRQARVTALLGMEIAGEKIDAILDGFGLRKAEKGWEVPSFRPDLTREIDLIEEIARVVGIDAIPGRVQAEFAPTSTTDRAYDSAMAWRRALVAQGFAEARTLTLIGEKMPGLTFLHGTPEKLRRVKNPMNDTSHPRPAVCPVAQALREMPARARRRLPLRNRSVFSHRRDEERTSRVVPESAVARSCVRARARKPIFSSQGDRQRETRRGNGISA